MDPNVLVSLLLYLLVFILVVVVTYQIIIGPNMSWNKKKKCSNCGVCCRFHVRLSEKDIRRIKTDVDYVENVGGKKWIKRKNGYCIFLEIKEGKSSCTIYSKRPNVCRKYPFGEFFGLRTKDFRCTKLK